MTHGPTPTAQPSGSLGWTVGCLGMNWVLAAWLRQHGPSPPRPGSSRVQGGDHEGRREDRLWNSHLLLIHRKLPREGVWLGRCVGLRWPHEGPLHTGKSSEGCRYGAIVPNEVLVEVGKIQEPLQLLLWTGQLSSPVRSYTPGWRQTTSGTHTSQPWWRATSRKDTDDE